MHSIDAVALNMLTPKQRRFVDEFLVDLNATQAAIRAAYSPRTANEQGARLLAKGSVADAVEVAQKARSERLQITQDEVLRGLRQEATLSGKGASHGARVSAWGLLGKHLGMFTERTQQLGPDGKPIDPRPMYVLKVER
jgi:phage terminase small subunit